MMNDLSVERFVDKALRLVQAFRLTVSTSGLSCVYGGHGADEVQCGRRMIMVKYVLLMGRKAGRRSGAILS